MSGGARVRTFLFTDIEGSTTRWEHQPEEMSVALRWHDGVVRAAIEQAGGVVFKTVGDAFCAVFGSAAGAVQAAIALQEALATGNDEGVNLRVRAAVHSGEAEERDNDYFGVELSRVARLLAAGYGGQILVSEAALRLSRGTFAGGIEAVSLGTHRLKDLTEPIQIFQVVKPGLRTNFPPLKTLSPRAHNLPVHLTSFVGREKELAATREVVKAARVVTLAGAGGSGKTRLAVEVAREVAGEFRDGAWFVDLAPVRDTDGVADAIARAVAAREDPTWSVVDGLAEALADRELLIVLDNCEHLVGEVADIAGRLLASCPRVHLLATSREPLGLPGERALPMEPLGIPTRAGRLTAAAAAGFEAVALFVDRAKGVVPRFELTDRNAGPVAEICTRLDGIPLAIELAAVKVKALSVEQIAARLEDRFRLLSGGIRGAPERHQTLRATIEWSYQMLSQREAAVFRRLAAFRGGWTLEAAEAVCAGEGVGGPELLEVLAQLVDRSLVVFEGEREARYRFLETIQAYSAELLGASGEDGAVRDAHVEYFATLAERAAPELWGKEAGEWHSRLKAEHNNIQAALERAANKADPPETLMRLTAALGWFWCTQDLGHEGLRWTELTLERAEGGPGRLRAEVVYAAAWLAAWDGDHTQAVELFRESIEAARDAASPGSVAKGLWGLGTALGVQGELDEALAVLREAQAMNASTRGADAEADWRDVAILNSLGITGLASGREREAEEHFRRAIARAEEQGLLAVAAAPHGNLGELYHTQGKLQEARDLYAKALGMFGEIGLSGMVTSVRIRLASCEAALGETVAATENLLGALASTGTLGSSDLIGETCLVAAGILVAAPVQSARALGAAHRHQRHLYPLDRLELERTEASLRGSLGSDAYEREHEAGGRMSRSQAIEFLRSSLEALIAGEGERRGASAAG